MKKSKKRSIISGLVSLLLIGTQTVALGEGIITAPNSVQNVNSTSIANIDVPVGETSSVNDGSTGKALTTLLGDSSPTDSTNGAEPAVSSTNGFQNYGGSFSVNPQNGEVNASYHIATLNSDNGMGPSLDLSLVYGPGGDPYLSNNQVELDGTPSDSSADVYYYNNDFGDDTSTNPSNTWRLDLPYVTQSLANSTTSGVYTVYFAGETYTTPYISNINDYVNKPIPLNFCNTNGVKFLFSLNSNGNFYIKSSDNTLYNFATYSGLGPVSSSKYVNHNFGAVQVIQTISTSNGKSIKFNYGCSTFAITNLPKGYDAMHGTYGYLKSITDSNGTLATFSTDISSQTDSTNLRINPVTYANINVLSPMAKSSANFSDSGGSVLTQLNYKQPTTLLDSSIPGGENELTSIVNPEGNVLQFDYAAQVYSKVNGNENGEATQSWALTDITLPTNYSIQFGYGYLQGPFYYNDNKKGVTQENLACTEVDAVGYSNGPTTLQSTYYNYDEALEQHNPASVNGVLNFDTSQSTHINDAILPLKSGDTVLETAQQVVELGGYDDWFSNLGKLIGDAQKGYITSEYTTSLNGPKYTTLYSYAPDGNLMSEKVYHNYYTNSSSDELMSQKDFTYDDNYTSFSSMPLDYNEPQTITLTTYEAESGVAGSSRSTVEKIGYDKYGNMISDTVPDGQQMVTYYSPTSTSASGMLELPEYEFMIPNTSDSTKYITGEQFAWRKGNINGNSVDQLYAITEGNYAWHDNKALALNDIMTVEKSYDATSGSAFMGYMNNTVVTQNTGASYQGDITSIGESLSKTLNSTDYPGYLVESSTTSGTSTISGGSTTSENGAEYVYSYLGKLLYKKDVLGNTVSYQYDSLGRETNMTYTPVGGTPQVTTYTYNEYPFQTLKLNLSNSADDGYATSSVDVTYPTGYQKISYYNQQGHMIAEYDKENNEKNFTLQTSYSYNTNGTLYSTTNYSPTTSNGSVTQYCGESVVTYDPSGRPIVTEGQYGQISGIVYDDSDNMQIHYTADNTGKLNGYISVGVYNSMNRLVDSYSFTPSQLGDNIQSELIQAYTASSTNNGKLDNNFYDRLKNNNFIKDMISQVNTLISNSSYVVNVHNSFNGYGIIVSTTLSWYDNGKLIQTTSTSSQTLDGTVATATDALGNTIVDKSNILGELNSETLTPGSKGESTYTVGALKYNGVGELISSTNTLGATTIANYNTQGQLISTEDADGNKLDYLYYDNGQPCMIYNDQKGEQYYYTKEKFNDNGQLSELLTQDYDVKNGTDEILGHTDTTYGYNSDGTSASKTFTNYSMNSGWETQVITDSYDTARRVTQVQDNIGPTLNYVYTNGELSNVWSGNGTKDNLEDNTFTYDSMGNLATINGLNGESTVYSYSPLGLLKSKSFQMGAEGVTSNWYSGSDVYTYDSLGRMKTDARVEENSGTQVSQDLSTENTYDDNSGFLMNYKVNSSHYLYPKYAGKQIGNISYTYDSLGNLQLKNVYDKSGNTLQTLKYAYNKNYPMQLSSLSTNGISGSSITYNNEEEMLTDYNGNTFYYDPTGSMVQTTPSSGLTQDYVYGPEGVAQSYLDSNSSQLEMYMDGETFSNQGNYYVSYLPDGYVTGKQGDGLTQGAQSFENFDSQGNVEDILPKLNVVNGEHSNAIQMDVYTPYNERSTFSQNFVPVLPDIAVGALGEQQDDATGYTYLGNGNRAYDPNTGRFLNQDALSPFNAGGVNGYAYCGGEPVNSSDPSGNEPGDYNPHVDGGGGNMPHSPSPADQLRQLAGIINSTTPDKKGGLLGQSEEMRIAIEDPSNISLAEAILTIGAFVAGFCTGDPESDLCIESLCEEDAFENFDSAVHDGVSDVATDGGGDSDDIANLNDLPPDFDVDSEDMSSEDSSVDSDPIDRTDAVWEFDSPSDAKTKLFDTYGYGGAKSRVGEQSAGCCCFGKSNSVAATPAVTPALGASRVVSPSGIVLSRGLEDAPIEPPNTIPEEVGGSEDESAESSIVQQERVHFEEDFSQTPDISELTSEQLANYHNLADDVAQSNGLTGAPESEELTLARGDIETSEGSRSGYRIEGNRLYDIEGEKTFCRVAQTYFDSGEAVGPNDVAFWNASE